MKKIISVLLSILIILSSFPVNEVVSAKEKYTEYYVPFHSDKTNQTSTMGISNKKLLKKGILMIPISVACDIADAEIKRDNENCLVITRNTVSWCLNYKNYDNQYLLIDMSTGMGDYYKSIEECLIENNSFRIKNEFEFSQYVIMDEHDNRMSNGFFRRQVNLYNKTNIMCDIYDNRKRNGKPELYVSAVDFLSIMGVNISLINQEMISDKSEEMATYISEVSPELSFYLTSDILRNFLINSMENENVFFFSLGNPIDELYLRYNSNLKFYLSNYYNDIDVFYSNILASFASYDNYLMTVLSYYNIDLEYDSALKHVIGNVGKSEDSEDNIGMDLINISSSLGSINFDIAKYLTSESIKSNKNLSDQYILNQKKELGKMNFASEAFDIGVTAIKGYIEGVEQYEALSTLSDTDSNLLSYSILSSNKIKKIMEEKVESSNGIDKVILNILPFIKPKTMILTDNWLENEIKGVKNLTNIENDYSKLYISAKSVQFSVDNTNSKFETILWNIVKGEVINKLNSVVTDILDKYLFKGVPVITTVDNVLQVKSAEYKNTPYAIEAINISELDDYYFIQKYSNDCFDEFYLGDSPYCEYCSFIMCVKSSLSAYMLQNKIEPSHETKDKIEELKSVLNNIYYSNNNYYRFSNFKIQNLHMLVRELREDDIVINNDNLEESQLNDTEIDYEKIYYDYIENNLVPEYGISEMDDKTWDEKKNMFDISLKNVLSSGLLGYYLDDLNNDGKEELIVTVSKDNPESFKNDTYIQLYSYDNNINKVELRSENKVSFNYSGYDGIEFERIDILESYDKEKYICTYSQRKYNGLAKEIYIYKISDNDTFEFCVHIYDPGASTGRDFYYNDIFAKENESYSDFEHLYGVSFGEKFDTEMCHDKFMEKLAKYGFDCLIQCNENTRSSAGVYIDLINTNVCISKSVITSYDNFSSFFISENKYSVLERNDPFKILIKSSDSENLNENINGYYSNSDLYVNIDAEENTVRIEYVNPDGLRSIVKTTCDISDHIEFTAKDNSGNNKYILNYSHIDNSLDISIKQIEITNELNGWSIPDINVNLPKTSAIPRSYDISNWSIEMIVDAVNNYLSKENKLELQLADVYGNQGILRNKDTGETSKYKISWGNEDFAVLNLRRADFIGSWFHLSDYIDAKMYKPENTWNQDYEFNIEDYYGEFSSDFVNIKISKIPDEYNDNYHSVEVYITMALQNGRRVGEAKCRGCINNNIIVLDGSMHDYFITIKDNKLFFSCYLISPDEYFKEVVNKELYKHIVVDLREETIESDLSQDMISETEERTISSSSQTTIPAVTPVQIEKEFFSINSDNIFYADTSLLGLSFEDVKSKLNMDLSEPVDFPYWGYQLKICDISYNGIKVCLTFQFGKLVMVIYDTFRPLTEKVMNDSSKVHGNPVEYGHWKTNDVDFLIYEDYYLDEQTYGYKQSYEIPHVE